jgi:hypothetical protein
MFQACTVQTWVKWGSSAVIQSANCTISKYLSSFCRSLARIQSALAIRPRKPPSATVVKASSGGAFFNGGRARQAKLAALQVEPVLHLRRDAKQKASTANSGQRHFINSSSYSLITAESFSRQKTGGRERIGRKSSPVSFANGSDCLMCIMNWL